MWPGVTSSPPVTCCSPTRPDRQEADRSGSCGAGAVRFRPPGRRGDCRRIAEVLDFVRDAAGNGEGRPPCATDLERSFGVRLEDAEVKMLVPLANESGHQGVVGRADRTALPGPGWSATCGCMSAIATRGCLVRNVTTQQELAADPREKVLGPNDVQVQIARGISQGRFHAAGEVRVLSALLVNLMRPSLAYNQSETEIRRQAARDAVQPILIQVKKGRDHRSRRGPGQRRPGQQADGPARPGEPRGVWSARWLGLLLGSFHPVVHRPSLRPAQYPQVSTRESRPAVPRRDPGRHGAGPQARQFHCHGGGERLPLHRCGRLLLCAALCRRGHGGAHRAEQRGGADVQHGVCRPGRLSLRQQFRTVPFRPAEQSGRGPLGSPADGAHVDVPRRRATVHVQFHDDLRHSPGFRARRSASACSTSSASAWPAVCWRRCWSAASFR